MARGLVGVGPLGVAEQNPHLTRHGGLQTGLLAGGKLPSASNAPVSAGPVLSTNCSNRAPGALNQPGWRPRGGALDSHWRAAVCPRSRRVGRLAVLGHRRAPAQKAKKTPAAAEAGRAGGALPCRSWASSARNRHHTRTRRLRTRLTGVNTNGQRYLSITVACPPA